LRVSNQLLDSRSGFLAATAEIQIRVDDHVEHRIRVVRRIELVYQRTPDNGLRQISANLIAG